MASTTAPRSLGAVAGDGLQVFANARGHFSRSIAAVGESGNLVFDKPSGATVHKAFLSVASQGYQGSPLSTGPTLAGHSVPLDNATSSQINSYNYFTDVTDIVSAPVNAAVPGTVSLSLVENDPLEEAAELVVIYDNPAVTAARSITVMFGALKPSGDTYGVNLTEPVNLSAPDTHMDMSLGIDYSYQDNGTPQYSTIDVNGQRLTSSAGGSDDGSPYNGALVTAGGYGDSTDNPPDPTALPTGARSDDELYNLLPFVHDGDTKLTVTTTNPSNDDNIFLAVLNMNPPVNTVTTDGDGSMLITPPTQIARLGLDADVTAYPEVDPFPPPLEPDPLSAPFRGTIVSGANTGRALNVRCAVSLLSCNNGFGQPSSPLTLTPGREFTAGKDRVRIWLDSNSNDILDAAEQYGTTTIQWAAGINAVGMGDSYSSGEGVGAYESGTDDDWGSNRNQCHRSDNAYPRLTKPGGYTKPLRAYLGGPTGTTLDFVACSGATTANVVLGGTEQYPGEGGSQIDQEKLTNSTDLVTISIGGNDLGFTPVIKACVRRHCGQDDSGGAKVKGQDVHAYLADKIETYQTSLSTVLKEIKEAAPDATVVLVGYPHLFPSPDDPGRNCETLTDLVYSDTQDWMNRISDQISDVEAQVAAQVGVNYLSAIDTFRGHEICAQAGGWLAGVTVGNAFDWFHGAVTGTGSFHPTERGQQAYADMINGWLANELSSGRTFAASGLPGNPSPTSFARTTLAEPLTATSTRTAAATSTGPTTDLGDLEISAAPEDATAYCYPDGVVASGRSTRLWGAGFAPYSSVTLTWENPDSNAPAVKVGTANVSKSGQVATTFTVPMASADSYGIVRADGTRPDGTTLELIGDAGVAHAVCPPRFAFTGFYAPVNNMPTVNAAKAGSAIPVKFSLGGNQGSDVFAAGSPSSQRVSCDSGAPTDGIEQTVAVGATTLTYDSAADRYQYVWKTDSAWLGTCRKLAVALSDGTVHSAVFSFK